VIITDKEIRKMIKKIKLSELKNMAYIMAKKSLEVHGEYFCILDGKKVEVVI
jgi:hypothetical protein